MVCTAFCLLIVALSQLGDRVVMADSSIGNVAVGSVPRAVKVTIYGIATTGEPAGGIVGGD